MSHRIIDLPPARIPELVPLAQEFYAGGDLPGGLDPDVFCRTWASLLFHGAGVLLAAERDGKIIGSIGGTLAPDPRDGELVLNETHWFVADQHRRGSAGIALWEAFEAEAVRRGAARVTMAHLANKIGEKIAPMLLRGGYRPVEVHYVLDLATRAPFDPPLVIDNLLESPQHMRRAALAKGFGAAEFDGREYRGVARASESEDAAVADAVRYRTGKGIKIKLSLFRSGRAEGDDPTTYIHADSAVKAQYAGVLYLTRDSDARGGTAFWRHRSLGIEALPGFVTQEFADRLNHDGGNESLWEMTRMVDMQFNRFVIYPTSVFHSRYPRQGFGQSLEDSRLIYACFFDMEN